MISKKLLNTDRSQDYSDAYLDEMVELITKGDRKMLARAITLVESNLPRQERAAARLLAQIPQRSDAKCIAITGSPGVGKSSFIESIGSVVLEAGKRVAVLSIDPSSVLTHGSILGDKTRMPALSVHPRAFVRPSPSSGDLGGVSRRTQEVKLLCEAAGYDIIFIETVGVGQSESQVRHLSDMVVVLMQPGAGDDLQSIKKGLNESADFFIVNKADGSQMELAREAHSHLLASMKFSGQQITSKDIILHSNTDVKLAQQCWSQMLRRYEELHSSLVIQNRRREQKNYWYGVKSERAIVELFTSLGFIKDKRNYYFELMNTEELSIQAAIELLMADINNNYIK